MVKYLIMQGVVRTRILLFLLGLVLVPIGSVAIILFARGYRPDFGKGSLRPTGLLVANSYPDGAQVFVNGQLKTATNSTFNLSPGEYQIEIKKDGFSPWTKHLQVEPEIVTRATAFLFPTVPSLKAVTSIGAANPSPSLDNSKVIFTKTSVNPTSRSELYLLDLNESPLGLLNREARLLISSPEIDFALARFVWSPDSRQILVYENADISSASASAYLINVNSSQLQRLTDNGLATLSEWLVDNQTRNLQRLETLPLILQEIISTASANISWSPKENKLLYTATASAVIPQNLIRPLPGSSTQPEERLLQPGRVYIYDLEEDRNFYIQSTVLPTTKPLPTPTPKNRPATTPKTNPNPIDAMISELENHHPSGFSWFPTSMHIFRVETNLVLVREYDNQNETIIYSGPMEKGIAIPYTSAKQLLILTNLTPNLTTENNLYAVSLR